MPPSNLHVEVPHVDGPPAGLADQGVAFDQQPRQRLAALGPIAQRKAPLAELLVAELLQLRLQGGDLGQQRGPTRQPPVIQTAGQTRQLRPNATGNIAHGVFGRSMMSTGRLDASLLPRGWRVRTIGFCPATLPSAAASSTGLGVRSSPAATVRVAATVVTDAAGTRAPGCAAVGGIEPGVEKAPG